MWRRLRAKTIVLSSSKEKKRRVATLGPHSIMPLAIVPFAFLISRIVLHYPRILHPLLLVLPLRCDDTVCVRLPNLHPCDRASISRCSISLMKIIASHGERSEMKSSRSRNRRVKCYVLYTTSLVRTGQSRERTWLRSVLRSLFL